jgi:Ni,Fe-hydrogenase I large subunit
MELTEHLAEPTFIRSEPRAEADGYGLINASRGSLGHRINITVMPARAPRRMKRVLSDALPP